MQTHVCSIVLCCRDFHISIRWHGCSWYWEMEGCKWQVSILHLCTFFDPWVFYVIFSVNFLDDLPIFSPRTSIEVSAILLGLILVGRAAFVFPLSILSNFKKSPREKIDFKQQVRTNSIIFIPTLQGPYLVTYFLLSSFHQQLFADYNMVGWTHARCCVHGPCIQPGK